MIYHYTVLHFSGRIAPSGVLSMGYCGVSFFFVLSGFILAYNYGDRDFSDAKIFRSYIWARVARIYPLYVCGLLLGLPFFIAELLRSTGSALIGTLAAIPLAPLALQSWFPEATSRWNGPGWAVSTQFFFYLIFPWVVGPALRRPGRWALIAVLGFVITNGIYLGLQQLINGDYRILAVKEEDSAIGYSLAEMVKFFPLGRWPEFLAGILTFSLWKRHGDRIHNGAMLALFLIATAFLIMIQPIAPLTVLHNGGALIAVVPLVLYGAGVSQGWLLTKPMLALGQLSFAVYLLHMPVLNIMLSLDKRIFVGLLTRDLWVMTALAIIMAFAVSATFSALVERPMRRYLLRAQTAARPTPANT